MLERWEEKLKSLRRLEMSPEHVWARIEQGPRPEPPTPVRTRVLAGVVAFAVVAAGGAFAWFALRPSGRSTTAIASEGNYVIDEVRVLGPKVDPQTGEPDVNEIQVAFRVRWSGDTFPGVHNCTYTAYGPDGSVVGSTTDALVSLAPSNEVSPGQAIRVSAEAARADASCSPERIDEVLAYDVLGAEVTSVAGTTANVSYTVRWPDSLAPDEWPSPNACEAVVHKANGDVAGSSTFSNIAGPTHPTSFGWDVPLTTGADTPPSPEGLTATVRCRPFGSQTGSQAQSAFFPTYHPESFMDALLANAVLEMRDGCLFANGLLLVWPEGFTYAGGVVSGADGRVVAAVGDRFSVGGGLVDPSYAEQVIGQPIPDACRGGPESVWLVGQVVEPTSSPTGDLSGSVLVPDVMGLQRVEAETILEDLGLKPVVDPAGEPGDDLVKEQSPEPGTAVAPGTTVVIAVGCFPAPCPAPMNGETIYDPCSCSTRR